jgi:anti-sigma factor RsiW
MPDPKPEAIRVERRVCTKENDRGEVMKLSKIITGAALAAVLGAAPGDLEGRRRAEGRPHELQAFEPLLKRRRGRLRELPHG